MTSQIEPPDLAHIQDIMRRLDLLDELKTLDKKTDKRRKLIHKYIKEAREKMIEERRSDGEIRLHAPVVDSMAVSMKKIPGAETVDERRGRWVPKMLTAMEDLTETVSKDLIKVEDLLQSYPGYKDLISGTEDALKADLTTIERMSELIKASKEAHQPSLGAAEASSSSSLTDCGGTTEAAS